jgi:predicted metal-dependent peptidase
MTMLSHRAAELRILQAQTTLITMQPFFAIMLFRLAKVPDPSAETIWTDGRRLGYDPAYVMSLPRDQLVGVLAHEVVHVASLHPFRQGTRDNHAWNVACDHVANAVVLDAGLVLPDGALPAIRDKCPEELYVAPPPPSGGGSPESNKGSSRGAGSAPPQDGNAPSTPGAVNDPGSETSERRADASCGEVRPPTNPDGTAQSQAERTKQMEETRILVQQALTAARRAGNVPAGIERLAAETLEPQIPWREVLARFIDDQARHDYSWMRPNRRYVGNGIMLPSLWSPAYGKIVMGCDTSGSVSKEQLTDIGSEVIGALGAYEERGQMPTLTVAWFDTAVYPQVVQSGDELKPQGGGGTHFSVVFDWVSEQEERPRGIVMVTDGHSSKFGDDPGVPVLWVLTAPHRRFRPPFGEVAFTLNG